MGKIDKESLNIVRGYIGQDFMSGCITNINFAKESLFELYKHESKIMRLPRTPENQKLKIAFRKIQNLVSHLIKLADRRQHVRKAMAETYYYTQIHSTEGANLVKATYQDLIKKFGRVKVEIIKIGGNYGQVVDRQYKVNKVGTTLWDKWSYTERV